ncbi:MAG: hypothetical protein PHU80_10835, partial [Kiritimatiellae bacterium]|nr:hypothetical protein [Kiritimatiellia bacterium]
MKTADSFTEVSAISRLLKRWVKVAWAVAGLLVLVLPARAGWVAATGGTETYYEQNGIYYHAHIFTDVGASTFTVTQGGEVEYLVVGGGGGGGGGAYHENNGGGGGAGGFQTAVTSVVASTYAIVVGAGGAGGTETAPGSNGGQSAFDSIISYGGGAGGGGILANSYPAQNGDSGGGA